MHMQVYIIYDSQTLFPWTTDACKVWWSRPLERAANLDLRVYALRLYSSGIIIESNINCNDSCLRKASRLHGELRERAESDLKSGRFSYPFLSEYEDRTHIQAVNTQSLADM